MRVNHALLAACIAAMGAPAAATNPTVADLDAIQGKTILFRAQASQAKAQQELQDASGVAAPVQGPSENVLPTARGIFGANGRRYVVFQYPNGGMAEGVAGQTLPGNFRVLAFDNTGVDLRGPGGKKHRIPFSAQAPTAPAPAPAPASSAFPAPVTVPPLR